MREQPPVIHPNESILITDLIIGDKFKLIYGSVIYTCVGHDPNSVKVRYIDALNVVKSLTIHHRTDYGNIRKVNVLN